jgi:20S proteasome subunit beta 4
MDTVFGVQYEGGVILAADQSNARSILLYQTNLDKVKELTSHSAMGVSGPNCDMVNFCEFVAKNIKLYELSNDIKLSTHAQANFARGELATALRKGPFQVNTLLGGFDNKAGASLYYLDYMAALQKVNYGSQGYASNFCLSIMDKEYRDDLNEADAVKIVEQCIHELHTRFLISQKNFIIKVVDKDGVRLYSQGADPADS